MKKITLQSLFLFCLFLFSCEPTQKLPTLNTDDGLIEFTFLQVNDVYEIAPLDGGKVGGMARVATVYKELKAENPNTFFVLAGDFLNPSLIGTMKHEGKYIAGQQMIEAMNAAGVDLVAFGNHEFDVSEATLQERLNNSNFTWIGTNVMHKKGNLLEPFCQVKNGVKKPVPSTYTWKIEDKDGTKLSIGMFSATINSNPKPFVDYQDYRLNGIRSYNELLASTDLVIGLTHLAMEEDIILAGEVPRVPLIMGGHEHHQMEKTVNNVKITKADANAKTAYIHRFKYNTKTKTATFTSEIKPITDKIADELVTQKVVDKWNTILENNVKSVYRTPRKIIYTATTPLDGRSKSVRTKQTNLGQMIANGIKLSGKKPVAAAFVNAGAIRIDDQLEGKIEAIDIFRVLPFGGQIYEGDMKGADLIKLLTAASKKLGGGSFFQMSTSITNNGQWSIDGKAIDPAKIYHIAANDYLMKKNAAIIQNQNKPTENNDPRSDLRIAVINYMSKL